MRALAILLSIFIPAIAQDKSAANFDTWWNQFRVAAAKKDAATVTKGVRFPMQWENGPTRDVKTAVELSGRLDLYLTPEIQKIIATRKPISEGREGYTITWKARGNEYSLYFKDRGHGWALDGLSEGPP